MRLDQNKDFYPNDMRWIWDLGTSNASLHPDPWVSLALTWLQCLSSSLGPCCTPADPQSHQGQAEKGTAFLLSHRNME